jgi:hypothetical protein
MTVRTLHLIDAENIFGLGGSMTKPGTLGRLWSAYAKNAVTHRPDDVVIVASGPGVASAIWFELPSGFVKLIRHGKDGADHALLEAFDALFVPGIFDEVVIASGDHIFARAAIIAKAAGTPVHLVIGRAQPSAALLATSNRRTYVRTKRGKRSSSAPKHDTRPTTAVAA